ncbi:hypothetical protein [Enhydrobacter sp.]|jgi:hypothetical protein|uniref:hypothetical protein n=1 Tax=Enhydrobacter sp. TaxID=1894999 RepID=UPI0026195D20|nr:hypothetical protein [Enhydrobacter sp.]WIM09299.1 MAG: hypothetical protein OJF58_000250 [Enhydrobacter sp.]
MPDHLEAGTLARRTYELFLPNATDASVAITLGDMAHDSPAASFARHSGATHYGLISMRNVPDGPRHPVVWSLHETMLAVTGVGDDEDVGQDMRRVIVRLLAVFFHEICAIAPGLSTSEFAVANDRPLN